MGDDVVIIDVQAQFTDKTASGMKKAKDSSDKLGESIAKTQKQIEKINKSKMSIDANDKATSKINKALSAGKAFAGKVFSATINTVDKATSVIGKITGGIRGFAGRTFTGVMTMVDKVTGPLRSITNALFSVKTLIATVAAGFVFKMAVGDAVKLADAITSAEIGFETMLGSAKAADQFMKDIKQFAIETPFETMDIVSNAQGMMAMGWTADTVLRDLERIGNVSASLGKGSEGISQIVRALGQMQMKGKVSAEEMLQLSEAGVAGWRYLAEGAGVSIAEVQDMTSKNKIAVEDAIKYIMAGMDQYGGLMTKTANRTVNGIWSQIKDTFTTGIFEKWGRGLQKGVIGGLKSMLAFLDKIGPAVDSLGDALQTIGEDISLKFAGTLDGVLGRAKDVINSHEFQSASGFGKIKIAWDKIIWEPLSTWWESKVVPKMAEKAAKLGNSIGKGITYGLLALLGVDVSNMIDGGVSVGASFAKGFVEGFDGAAVGAAIRDAIGGAFKNAAKIIPGGESASASSYIAALISLWGAGKLIKGVGGLARGAKGALFGTPGIEGMAGAAGIGTAGILGNTGNAMVRGSGILGKFAGAGYALKGGAATSTLSGGAAAAFGGAGIAGGVVGGVSLISGVADLLKSSKSNNKEEANAYGRAGGAKVGGVAVGAAMGAAVGSLVPVIGTAIGALVGAGIGGIAGLISGKKIKENYQNSQKVLQATGYAVGEVKFETDALNKAIKDSSVSAEDFGKMFQAAVGENLIKHFGDIELSMAEIQEIAKNLTFKGEEESMDNFNGALTTADNALATLQTSMRELDRINWKISLGKNLVDTDTIQEFSDAIDSMSSNAKAYVENKHYEGTMALQLLGAFNEASEAGLNKMFATMDKQIGDITTTLSEKMSIAMKDGIITLDEQKELINLQQQITDITNKLTSAQENASFDKMQIKYGGASLTAESFTQLQAEIEKNVSGLVDGYDKALETGLTNLNLQLSEGIINDDTFEKLKDDLSDNYQKKITELSSKVGEFQIGMIADAYSSELSSILPGLEGTINEKLSAAMNAALFTNPDVANWTQKDINSWFGLESLSAESQTAIGAMLKETAATFPAGYAESIGEVIGEGIIDGIKKKMVGPLGLEIPTPNSSSNQPKIPTYYNSNIPFPTHANGGFMNSPHIGMVGEDGPEVIIPLGADKQSRGRSLWAKAGALLGVKAYADGGQIGTAAGSGKGVQIGNITINVSGSGNGSLVQQIREQKGEIAEEIAEIVSEALEEAYENMPISLA